jgi:hypothetical protein
VRRAGLLFVAGALLAAGAAAQAPAERFRAANAHALAGDPPRAIAAYQALAGEGHESPALYWNWAQAAHAQGAAGEALWALLRAREIDPRDRALGREIERTRERLGLEEAELAPEPLAELARAARRFRLGLVAALCALISVALHAGARVRHGSPRAAAVAFGLAACAALPVLLGAAAKPVAVVVAADASLLDQASPQARPLGALREGEVVPVLERAGDWLRIEDASGARGWARAADVRELQRR